MSWPREASEKGAAAMIARSKETELCARRLHQKGRLQLYCRECTATAKALRKANRLSSPRSERRY